MAELVYAYASEAYPARVGSSNLPTPTQFRRAYARDAYGATLGVRVSTPAQLLDGRMMCNVSGSSAYIATQEKTARW